RHDVGGVVVDAHGSRTEPDNIVMIGGHLQQFVPPRCGHIIASADAHRTADNAPRRSAGGHRSRPASERTRRRRAWRLVVSCAGDPSSRPAEYRRAWRPAFALAGTGIRSFPVAPDREGAR